MDNQEKNNILAKKIECLIGIFFLIPPILGVISFILNLFGGDSGFAGLYNLSAKWTARYEDGGGMSAAPIYLGIMAFVGAYLIKDNLKYLFIKRDTLNKNNWK